MAPAWQPCGLRRATDDLVAPNGLIGTPDGRTLFITARDSVYTLDMRIRGASRPRG